MAILGAHMSIAGGYFRAVEAAAQAGCDCVQLFTKNNSQWAGKPIRLADVEQFREALGRLEISRPLAHASYLINLASPDRTLHEKSIAAMIVELQRAAQLGIPGVVLHPGSFTTSDEATGIRKISKSLDRIYKQTARLPVDVLLENTAGQGSNLGWRFEQIRQIIDRCRYGDRLGICIDTCHAFAAGYDMATAARYEATMDELDRILGLSRIRAIHLNDSKKPFGSRRDRHEHIGRGEIGLKPFRYLLNDARFATTPMYLETPKGDEKGRNLDEINLETLRGLVRKSRAKPKPRY